MTMYRVNPGETLNWDSTGTWKDGAKPVSGASNYVVFEGGFRYMFNAGLDQSGVNLAGIIVERGATVSLPGLKIDLNQADGEGLVTYGSGEVQIADGTISRVLSFFVQSVVRLVAGTAPLVHAANGGRVYVSDAALTEVVADGSTIDIAAKSANRISVEMMNGGVIKCSRDVSSGIGGRGLCVLREGAAITDGGTGGEFKLIDLAAVLRMEHAQAVTHRSIRARAGLVDPVKCVVPPTWTYLYRSPAARVLEKCLTGRVAVTNRRDYGGEGDSMGVSGE